MSNLLTLSQQCETAGPEETRRLLEEALLILRPKPDRVGDDEAWWDRRAAWALECQGFYRLLDINTQEAFLGAVMMLKPDGARIEVIEMEDGRGAARLLWPGEGRLPKLEPLFPSLTLAALSAILRAEAAKQEKV